MFRTRCCGSTFTIKTGPAALERAWEAAVKDNGGDLEKGFMDAALPNGKLPTFPMLMLNGTSVIDGCRVSVSPFYLGARDFDAAEHSFGNRTADRGGVPTVQSKVGSDAAGTATRDCLALDPLLPKSSDVVLHTMAGTKDGFDNTCRENAHDGPQAPRLSTAALLSARFPYVSPTGTLNSCQNPNDRTYDLDGGLIDSSGASPLALTWPEVVNWLETQSGGKCFAPKLILIENGYLSQTKSGPPARPHELSAPLTATVAVSDAQSPEARQAAALDFQKSFPPGGCGTKRTDSPDPQAWAMPNDVDFYPVARPGIEAPLGWTLSKTRKSPSNNSSVTPTTCAPRRLSPPGSPAKREGPQPATEVKPLSLSRPQHSQEPVIASCIASPRARTRAAVEMRLSA